MVNGDVDGGAQSDLSREGSGYPSDLRDAEWARLAPLDPRGVAGRATAQDSTGARR